MLEWIAEGEARGTSEVSWKHWPSPQDLTCLISLLAGTHLILFIPCLGYSGLGRVLSLPTEPKRRTFSALVNARSRSLRSGCDFMLEAIPRLGRRFGSVGNDKTRPRSESLNMVKPSLVQFKLVSPAQGSLTRNLPRILQSDWSEYPKYGIKRILYSSDSHHLNEIPRVTPSMPSDFHQTSADISSNTS